MSKVHCAPSVSLNVSLFLFILMQIPKHHYVKFQKVCNYEDFFKFEKQDIPLY